jgi:hypothetical protein
MDSYGSPRHAIVFFRRKDQSLTMRHNTGLTAAPARPLYGSPVCKRSPIQVLTVLNVAFNFRDRGNGCFQHCIWPLALKKLDITPEGIQCLFRFDLEP